MSGLAWGGFDVADVGEAVVEVEPAACPGPMFWFVVPIGGQVRIARAIVVCQMDGCGFVVISPSPMDVRHAATWMYRSPADEARGGGPFEEAHLQH